MQTIKKYIIIIAFIMSVYRVNIKMIHQNYINIHNNQNKDISLLWYLLCLYTYYLHYKKIMKLKSIFRDQNN